MADEWNLQYTSFGPPLGSSIRLRDNATHITKTPTKTTMIVAINGTIKFKSNHCGIHGGKYVLPFSWMLLSGGASVPIMGRDRERHYSFYVPLWWFPLLRRMQITIMAIIMTRRAATTGTTRFKLDRMMRIVSSAVSSGNSREGAIVPETTNFVFCSIRTL